MVLGTDFSLNSASQSRCFLLKPGRRGNWTALPSRTTKPYTVLYVIIFNMLSISCRKQDNKRNHSAPQTHRLTFFFCSIMLILFVLGLCAGIRPPHVRKGVSARTMFAYACEVGAAIERLRSFPRSSRPHKGSPFAPH